MSVGRWVEFANRRGSTRAVGLIRIGLVLLLWSRFANELQLFKSHGNPWHIALSLAFFLSTTALFLGWKTRISAVLTAAVLSWMYVGWGFYGDRSDWTHHNTYLLVISSVWLAFTPCGRSFSLDRFLDLRRAEAAGRELPKEEGYLWGTTLLSAQVSALYLFSAWDKSSWFFLSGQHLEQTLRHFYTGSDPIGIPGFGVLCCVLAVGTVGLEYFLPVALYVRRWHRWTVPLGLAFHGVLYLVLSVATFSLTMAVLYLAYLDPQDVHDAIERMLGRVSPEEPSHHKQPPSSHTGAADRG